MPRCWPCPMAAPPCPGYKSAALVGTMGGSAPPPRQGQRPWTRYWNLQSKKPNNVPMALVYQAKAFAIRSPEEELLWRRVQGLRKPLPRPFPALRVEKRLFTKPALSQSGVQRRNSPGAGYRGCGSPCLVRSRRFVRKSACLPSQRFRNPESRGGTPLVRGTGAAEAPASLRIQYCKGRCLISHPSWPPNP